MGADVMLNVNAWWTGPHPVLARATYVWMQGCPRRCPGCCNTGALAIDRAAMLVTSEQLAAVCEREPRGVVLSGGEPFLQAWPLARSCALLRARVPDVPIIVYTGYVVEELLDVPGGPELLLQSDLLIDGPFEASRLSDSPLVGSSNQRLLFLTDRVTRAQVAAVNRPMLVVGVESGGIRMVGAGVTVPHMQRLARALAARPVGAAADR